MIWPAGKLGRKNDRCINDAGWRNISRELKRGELTPGPYGPGRVSPLFVIILLVGEKVKGWYNLGMPELPEVETIRRGLKGCILNKKVKGVEVECEKSFIGEKEEIIGAKIVETSRKGKALIIDLDNGKSILIHLRMTGQLIYVDEQTRFAGGHPNENFVAELPNKQTRVVIDFSTAKLFFNDQRKFGFMKVMKTDEVNEDKFIASLGKEPWEMGDDEFYEKLQRHARAPIKAVILDQKVIAGLGNIYADEALFRVGIHPSRLAGEVSREESGELLMAARAVMEKSIEAGGSTLQNYVKADGTRGDYLEKFAQVFHREGQKCFKCGAEIVKIRVAGRGTHICPRCQK